MPDAVKSFGEFLEERELPDKQGKIIILLGKPGSGKGTIAGELKSNYGFQHLSTGEVLRKSDDEEVRDIMKKGELVSDDLMVKVLRRELRKLDLEKGIIFDGFPRTIKQARRLDRMLGKLGVGLNNVILLQLDTETAKDRIRRRAEKENRPDDAKEETIEKRFDEYREKTKPLIDFYDKSRKLIRIPADEGKNTVLKRIVKRLDLKDKSTEKEETL